ncbi:mitochondrial protein Pet127-domain-containing protein, partial [Parasitella parasitica]
VPPPNHVEVPTLAHGLEKVLFKPGVHFLRDPATKLYNFTSYLENITQPVDFDYDSLQPYITSSQDTTLVDLARKMQKRYIGSTSSVSATLSHFYFVMSNFKPVETSFLSQAFQNEAKFTRGSRTPASIYLRWKDGVYAVDADKSYDVDETILSVLGKSMEKVLTSEPDEFEKCLKENSSQLTEEEKNQAESYAYGECGKFLLRSQLDCYDPKLPRGTFDLKTRAVMPVRLDIQNYAASSAFCLHAIILFIHIEQEYLGYKLKRYKGLYESFEREYYDMIRSAFLKYCFQVRIGHMDGIMVAYHNTSKIFGFQYISREEMDSRLFGSSKIGNQVFRNALVMFESILDRATEKYPQQTLRLSFDTRK